MPTKQVSDLSHGQLRILTSLWESGPSFRDDLADDHGLNGFDLDLAALVRDGFVKIDKETDGEEVYVAAIAREVGFRDALHDLADKIFGGSMSRLVQTLLGDKKPTLKERAVIERHLKQADSQLESPETKLPNDGTPDR